MVQISNLFFTKKKKKKKVRENTENTGKQFLLKSIYDRQYTFFISLGKSSTVKQQGNLICYWSVIASLEKSTFSSDHNNNNNSNKSSLSSTIFIPNHMINGKY